MRADEPTSSQPAHRPLGHVAAERASRPGDFASTGARRRGRPAIGRARSARATRRRPRRRSRPTAPTATGCVRVVPNLYPAFDGDERDARSRNLGPVLRAGAGQRHPRGAGPHARARAQLGRPRRPQAGLVMAALRDRLEDHAAAAGIRYTPGHRQPRPGGRRLPRATRTASCSASRSCPASSSRRWRASAASRAAACCAPRSRPSAPPATASCRRRARGRGRARGGAARPFELLVLPPTHERHLHRGRAADAGGRRPRPARRAGPRSARCSATSPTTSCSTPRRTRTTTRSTGTSHIMPRVHSVGRVRAGHRRADQHRRPRGRRRLPRRLTARQVGPVMSMMPNEGWVRNRTCGALPRSRPIPVDT